MKMTVKQKKNELAELILSDSEILLVKIDKNDVEKDLVRFFFKNTYLFIGYCYTLQYHFHKSKIFDVIITKAVI